MCFCVSVTLSVNSPTCQTPQRIITVDSLKDADLCKDVPFGGLDDKGSRVPKILNFASEEVILELITRKCMPILLYGLESCQLSNGDLHSLDFTYNRMCMKLFKSSNIELIKECQGYFRCLLPS